MHLVLTCLLFIQALNKSMHMNGGPNGIFDHIVLGASILIVIIVIFFTLKFFIKPGEKQITHIKRIILDDDINSGSEGSK